MKYIFIVFISFQLHSQSATDSLKGKPLDYLFEKYNAVSELDKKHAYSEAIVFESKKLQDTTSLVAGYYFKSNLYNNDKSLSYLDSIINLKTNNSDKYQPAVAYINKGVLLHTKRELKSALDNYLKAIEFIKIHDNDNLHFKCKHYIAAIKYELGDNTNALKAFKENLVYFKKDKVKNKKDFLNTIFSISILYNELKQLDSASYYINYGYKEAEKFNNLTYLNYYKLSDGLNKYFKKEYDSSLVILKNCIPKLIKIEDESNLSVAYFYIAKIEQEAKNGKRAIEYFQKIDTLFQSTKKANQNIRDSYEELLKFKKRKEDVQSQLIYINKLIEVDSILHVNEVYLNKGIIRKYEIPVLIAEKERIINIINKKDNTKKIIIIIFLVLFVILIGLLYYQLIKKKLYKKRFIELSKKDVTSVNQEILKDITNNSINISEDIITRVLKELKTFEEKKEFLNYSVTLPFLAKKMNTNSKYLSKIINNYKQDTFINYVNRLRINHAINMLKEDSNYRKYTIKAISNEVGFKKAESFTKAFKKVSGITPSYFINEINKNP